MTPDKIVTLAGEMGVNILAISDHNSTGNVIVAMQLAVQEGIMLIPSMEAESREEAHILTLFPDLESLLKWQRIVDKNMSGIENNTRKFGQQLLVDAQGAILAEESRMLLGPLKLSAQEIVKHVTELGGICIPSHVDRPAFSLLGQLGFVTKKQGYTAVEISTRGFEHIATGKYTKLIDKMNIISNSDSHNLEQFLEGGKTEFYMMKPEFEELKMALANIDGRFVKPILSVFEQSQP